MRSGVTVAKAGGPLVVPVKCYAVQGFDHESIVSPACDKKRSDQRGLRGRAQTLSLGLVEKLAVQAAILGSVGVHDDYLHPVV